MATPVDGADLGDLDASNVLVLAPACDPADDEACSRLLSVAPVSEGDLLSVTVTRSPDDRLEVWRAHAGEELPAKARIVSVGDATRSAAVESASRQRPPGAIQVETVDGPGDLAGIGIEITRALIDWAIDDHRIVVCVHSLTALLQHASVERVVGFLDVLTEQLENADALAHYHLDPSVLEDGTVDAIGDAVDAVVELDGNGEWAVSAP